MICTKKVQRSLGARRISYSKASPRHALKVCDRLGMHEFGVPSAFSASNACMMEPAIAECFGMAATFQKSIALLGRQTREATAVKGGRAVKCGRRIKGRNSSKRGAGL